MSFYGLFAPTIPISVEENLRDPIDIRMNIIHPKPITVVAFPAATVVGGDRGGAADSERERASKAKTEGITLRSRVRSLELVETCFHGIVRDEREARKRLEHQLGLIQEELESREGLCHAAKKVSNEKRLEEVQSFMIFLKYFLEDLPGFPSDSHVNSKSIDAWVSDVYSYDRLAIGLSLASKHVKAILELLKKEELYAKFSKCKFWIPKVQFLGHVIDSQGIHVDPAKIESIKDWASSKTPTEIR
ncbi:hypothetical protein Tco_0639033 [Tanacetum coccineum]